MLVKLHLKKIFSVSDISVTIDPIKREDGQEIKVIMLLDSLTERNCMFEVINKVQAVFPPPTPSPLPAVPARRPVGHHRGNGSQPPLGTGLFMCAFSFTLVVPSRATTTAWVPSASTASSPRPSRASTRGEAVWTLTSCCNRWIVMAYLYGVRWKWEVSEVNTKESITWYLAEHVVCFSFKPLCLKPTCLKKIINLISSS